MIEWWNGLGEGNQIMAGVGGVIALGVVGFWLIEKMIDAAERREMRKNRRG